MPPETNPATAEMRRSPEAARQIVETLLPDPDARRAALSLLADAIERANTLNAASWSVMLFSGSLPGVRLNVGNYQTVVLGRYGADKVWVSVDVNALTEENRADLDAAGAAMEGGDDVVFNTLLDTRGVLVPVEWLSQLTGGLEGPLFRFVDRAVAIVRTRTGFSLAHSPGVLEYLEETLGRTPPQPDHGKAGDGEAGGNEEDFEDDKSNGGAARRFWLIAPGDNAKWWNKCLEHQCVVVRWGQHYDDFQQFPDKDALRTEFHGQGWGDSHVSVVERFTREMKPGDVVVARRGLKRLVA